MDTGRVPRRPGTQSRARMHPASRPPCISQLRAKDLGEVTAAFLHTSQLSAAPPVSTPRPGQQPQSPCTAHPLPGHGHAQCQRQSPLRAPECVPWVRCASEGTGNVKGTEGQCVHLLVLRAGPGSTPGRVPGQQEITIVSGLSVGQAWVARIWVTNAALSQAEGGCGKGVQGPRGRRGHR